MEIEHGIRLTAVTGGEIARPPKVFTSAIEILEEMVSHPITREGAEGVDPYLEEACKDDAALAKTLFDEPLQASTLALAMKTWRGSDMGPPWLPPHAGDLRASMLELIDALHNVIGVHQLLSEVPWEPVKEGEAAPPSPILLSGILDRLAELSERIVHACRDVYEARYLSIWQDRPALPVPSESPDFVERATVNRTALLQALSRELREAEDLCVHLTAEGAVEFFRGVGGEVPRRGDELVSLADAVEILKKVKLAPVSKDMLEGLKRKGVIPAPCRAGVSGEPHRWRWSVLRPILEAIYGVELPIRKRAGSRE